jgi:hypothetical protein
MGQTQRLKPRKRQCIGISRDWALRESAPFETAPIDRSGTSPPERERDLAQATCEHQCNGVPRFLGDLIDKAVVGVPAACRPRVGPRERLWVGSVFGTRDADMTRFLRGSTRCGGLSHSTQMSDFW